MPKTIEQIPFLCPWVESLTELPGTWWVAHTKSRQEKAFAWDLLNREIAFFLPLFRKRTTDKGRRRENILPLFPSYVFICGNEEDRYTSLTTNRLCQTIQVRDQEALIQELLCLEKALKGEAELDPYPEIVVGKRCRVIAGPYKDMEGTVIQKPSITRIVMEVTIIGQAASMEIDPEWIEVLG